MNDVDFTLGELASRVTAENRRLNDRLAVYEAQAREFLETVGQILEKLDDTKAARPAAPHWFHWRTLGREHCFNLDTIAGWTFEETGDAASPHVTAVPVHAPSRHVSFYGDDAVRFRKEMLKLAGLRPPRAKPARSKP